MFRRILASVLFAVAAPLAAQQPPKLEPLPEPPPPPPGAAADQPGEPAVRIEPGSKEQVEEEVVGGRRVVRVTTVTGSVYYLVEDLGDAPGATDSGTGSRVRVPLWAIRRF
jgi:Protein of unknown function (DUF2782)